MTIFEKRFSGVLKGKKITIPKGSVIPFQSILEELLGDFLVYAMPECYFETAKEAKEAQKQTPSTSRSLSFYVHKKDAVFVFPTDYEIIIRKKSHKRMEREAIERIKEFYDE